MYTHCVCEAHMHEKHADTRDPLRLNQSIFDYLLS